MSLASMQPCHSDRSEGTDCNGGTQWRKKFAGGDKSYQPMDDIYTGFHGSKKTKRFASRECLPSQFIHTAQLASLGKKPTFHTINNDISIKKSNLESLDPLLAPFYIYTKIFWNGKSADPRYPTNHNMPIITITQFSMILMQSVDNNWHGTLFATLKY